MMSEPDKEAVREGALEFKKRIGSEMLSCCGPIFIVPRVESFPNEMIDNGTFSLIRTDSRWLLVTCDHVWKGYLKALKTFPEAALCLNLGGLHSSIAFNKPAHQLIDNDPDLDLAVFDFDPEQIRAGETQIQHGKKWFHVRQWPIPRPAVSDYLFTMGFPGKRVKKSGMICTFVTEPLLFKITHVGHREIFIFNEGDNVDIFGEIKNALGGLSGSPAYTLGENGASLVGFVKSGYKPSASDVPGDSIFSGSLKLVHAGCLNPNGTLVHG
jgi:hypothetical protein